MAKSLLIAIIGLLVLCNFINTDLNDSAYSTPPYNNMEKYDPSMGSINSIGELEQHVDAVAKQKGQPIGSVGYVLAMEEEISKRFYHGFSHLKMNENWIAAISEKLLGFGLSCKVFPEDIMQHGNAACSQQSMVMMELLKRKGLSYRKVGFVHHYALEVQLNNSWYYFDPNMEPSITVEQRNVAHWKHAADNLKPYYDTVRFSDLDYSFGVNQSVIIGGINEKQAVNAKTFQMATGFLSKTLWLVPLCFLAFGHYRRKNVETVRASSSGVLSYLEIFFGPARLQKASPNH